MTTQSPTGKVRELQTRAAHAAYELGQIHAELLTLPPDVDTEAVPVIRRAITDAKFSAASAFYALGGLADSIEYAESAR